MKKYFLVNMLMSVFILAGCASAGQSKTYSMSYDQTYQAALEALDRVGAWRVSQTDQLDGLIILEKGGYYTPRRTAQVTVKRLEPFRTRIELHGDSSAATQEKFLDAITRHVENRRQTYPS